MPNRLTLRQRNEVFETLGSMGVDPAECELLTLDDAYEIHHQPTGSMFGLRLGLPSAFVWQWRVTDGANSGAPLGTGLWSLVIDQLGNWADEIQYVTTIPDYWQELQRNRDVITAVEALQLDNTPFVAAEQELIDNSIEAARRDVRERYSLPDKQLAAIEEKLDQLADASRTMGRKDWITLALSSGFSLIIGGVQPSIMQHVLGTVIWGVAHIFGVGLPPLPLA